MTADGTITIASRTTTSATRIRGPPSPTLPPRVRACPDGQRSAGSCTAVCPTSPRVYDPPVARKPSAASSLNVLFIGNSFTARNDLPGMLAALAKASNLHLDHRLISVGGASLRTHWNKGEAAKAIGA